MPDEIQIVDNATTTLRSIGKDESWLHNWIKEKPSRLGLGELVIKSSELIHYRNNGGRLDILAYRGDLDTYYEIEVMLGECDADHGFRTLDYWAREKLKYPNAKHFAVLIAEDLSGRYKTVIDTLPQFLPFLAIEIRVLRLEGTPQICTIDASVVAAPDELQLGFGDQPASADPSGAQPRDRTWWEAHGSPAFLSTVDSIARYCIESVGLSRLDYSAQSYISLKKGRRCWLPMWPRANGAYLYLPGGPDGKEDSPSEFYNFVREHLQEIGIEPPTWSYNYNAGANPIAFPVPADRATHSVIREILKRAYDLA